MSLPAIRASGDFFLNADGSEFHYVGLSEFALPKRILMPSGPEALVRPILVERRSIANRAGYDGPIVLRCFKYGHPNNAFGMPPWYDFAKLNDLAKMAAEYRMYVDFTTGDNQHVLPNPADQQRHMHESSAAVTVFHFEEQCNEPFKNGMDVAAIDLPEGPSYLRDSGAYGDIGAPGGAGWPMATILDYVSYHGTRSNEMAPRFPRWLVDMNDQIAVLRSHLNKPVVLKEPIGFDKTEIPGRRFNDPYLAKLLGHVVAYGGVCFHSTIGLSSDGYDPETMLAAGNYFTGVAGALR